MVCPCCPFLVPVLLCVCVWGETILATVHKEIVFSLRNAFLFVLKAKYYRDGHSTAFSGKRLVKSESRELCGAAFVK